MTDISKLEQQANLQSQKKEVEISEPVYGA